MEFYLWMWWSLIIVASIFIISSLDELVFDFVYLVAFYYRKFTMWKHHYKPLTVEQLCAVPEKKIAVMVACWHEDLVIEDMLRHNIPAINYRNYDIFVGVYPNDELTIQAVQRAQQVFKNIIPVTTPNPGPSTKSDNLNNIYQTILNLEKEKNIQYDIIVFHDAEDVIHPLSLKMYNYLIPRKDMIQIPVFPLEVNASYATHWTYNDEFAENHTKTMIAREIMGGLVTSAGVGTAFSRIAMKKLAEKIGGNPFSSSSFTEDYHVSLEIHLLNLKSIFLTQRILRIQAKKKWWFFGKLIPKKTYELVATRALFPTYYMAAVRQRARWIMGITLQEWQQSGWPGNWMTRYTLFHDRKVIISHVINFIAYLLFFYWLIYYLLGAKPTFYSIMLNYPFVYYMIVFCTIMMIFRLSWRAWATFRIYGLFPALLSIPRSVYSNILNCHAFIRALRSFFFTPKKDTKWDKTRNRFPSTVALKKYNKRLGDLLLENKVISPSQLIDALKLQRKDKTAKLGHILIENYAIRPDQITKVLALQFNINIVDPAKFPTLAKEKLEFINDEDYQWLLANHIFPVAFYKNTVTLAIIDPTNEPINKQACERLKPRDVIFVLLSDAV